MNQIVDINMKHDSRKIRANKFSLTRSSRYFKAMWASDGPDTIHEKTIETVELDLQDMISFEILEHVIGFVLRRSLLKPKKNTLEELILAADFFLIDELKEELGRKISSDNQREIVDISNVLHLWRLTLKQKSPAITEPLERIILETFEALMYEVSFVKLLDVELLVRILSSDNLKLTTEKNVFYAIEMWMNNEYMERHENFLRLLGCMRFDPQVDDHFLDTEVLSYCNCEAGNDFVAQYKRLRGEPHLVVGINVQPRSSSSDWTDSENEMDTDYDDDYYQDYGSMYSHGASSSMGLILQYILRMGSYDYDDSFY